jgi:preprotein translocase subunit SecG
MLTLIVIVALIACVLLIGVVLIQNPKGGGLSSSFGGMSNQVMGVQRTTDFLEKSTWTLMITVAIISLVSVFFIGKPTTATADKPKSQFEGVDLKTPQNTAPQQQQPAAQPQQQQPQGNANPIGDDQQAQPQQQPAK